MKKITIVSFVVLIATAMMLSSCILVPVPVGDGVGHKGGGRHGGGHGGVHNDSSERR